jgi:hypothetical protein
VESADSVWRQVQGEFSAAFSSGEKFGVLRFRVFQHYRHKREVPTLRSVGSFSGGLPTSSRYRLMDRFFEVRRMLMIDQRYGKLTAQQAEKPLMRLKTNHRAANFNPSAISKQEKT